MNLRCDYCRRQLGDRVHRYWHMRFCSPACAQAYQDRLNDETRTKIRRLDHGFGKHVPKVRGQIGSPDIVSLSRHLP
ncbi:MAG: hypothetical protein ACRECV_02645 [Xanthobacteraceae bacterium]